MPVNLNLKKNILSLNLENTFNTNNYTNKINHTQIVIDKYNDRSKNFNNTFVGDLINNNKSVDHNNSINTFKTINTISSQYLKNSSIYKNNINKSINLKKGNKSTTMKKKF